jgi:hypothetical protein
MNKCTYLDRYNITEHKGKVNARYYSVCTLYTVHPLLLQKRTAQTGWKAKLASGEINASC